MPRVCAREGCGVRLLRKNGRLDFHRYFCSSEHAREDRIEKLQEKRSGIRHGKKCPHCGRWSAGRFETFRCPKGQSVGSKKPSGVRPHTATNIDDLAVGKGGG